MQPVLPSSLDMTSAKVLGFDAQAYIDDTPSTLHRRLNIPGSFNAGDYYVSNIAAAPKKKTASKFCALAAVLTSATGIGALIFAAIKGKIKPGKILNNTKKSIPDIFNSFRNKAAKNINTDTMNKAAGGIKKFFGNIADKIKNIKIKK